LIDRILHGRKQGRRGHRSDGVDVTDECSGAAVEDYILNAGDLQEGKTQGAFVGAGG
jgi:hypothetical protein